MKCKMAVHSTGLRCLRRSDAIRKMVSTLIQGLHPRIIWQQTTQIRCARASCAENKMLPPLLEQWINSRTKALPVGGRAARVQDDSSTNSSTSDM